MIATPDAAADEPPEVQTNDSLPPETDALMSSLEHESDDLWNQHRLIALATLSLPVWASLVALAFAAGWGGLAFAKKLIVATIASAAAGRFVIWSGTSSDEIPGLSAWQLALLVLCLDAAWAVVLTWHAGVLFQVPWFGSRLRDAVREGRLLLKNNRWMRRMTVIAVLVFVMIPISSTGSIGGSLLGRLLGLPRRATLLAVIAGSVLGCAVMLAFAEALAPWFQNVSPAMRYGGIAMVVLCGLVLSRRYRRSMSANSD